MDAPGAVHAASSHSTPPDTNASNPVSPRTNEPRRSTPHELDEDSHGEGAHGSPSGSIRTLCVSFLDKIQQAYGEQSREWSAIHRALDDFMQGRISKKEAHHTMSQALGDNDEFTQGLFDVLYHKDARWGPDDFYQSADSFPTSQPVYQTSPDILQPQHEPQFRLPTMSQFMPSGQYLTKPHPSSNINPALLRSSYQNQATHESTDAHPTGQDLFAGYQGLGTRTRPPSAYTQNQYWNTFAPNGFSSPGPPMSNLAPLPQVYESPSLDSDSTSLQSYNNARYGTGFGSLGGQTGEQFYQQYPRNEDWHENNDWDDQASSERHHEYGQQRMSFEGHGPQPTISPQAEKTPQLAPAYLSPMNAPPSVLGTPVSVPIGQLTKESMVTGKRDRNDSTRDTPQDMHRGEAEYAVEFSEPINTKPRKSSDSGRFIHALCGKGFSSRNAVKKHHWGPKSEDVETHRGCWAKNGKPDRPWDEHPTCRQDTGVGSKRTRRTSVKKNEYTQANSGVKAPTAPSMIPSPKNVIPGLPTLNDLPDTVAEVVQPMANFPDVTNQFGFTRAPTGYGFDSLLTAASIASKLDAPKPQDGRNDSVASHLDAQVAAAERNPREPMPWMRAITRGETSVGKESPYTQGPSPLMGSGIAHYARYPVPPNMVLTSQSEETGGIKASAPMPYQDDPPASSAEDGAQSGAASRPATSGDEIGANDKRRRVSTRKSVTSKREQK